MVHVRFINDQETVVTTFVGSSFNGRILVIVFV